MITIRIMNEFLHGPLWTLDSDGISTQGLPIIENDPVLQALNEKIGERFDSYYEFDSHDQPCWFNETQRNADRALMLDWLQQLKNRLDEINDGSFVIEDLETPAWEESPLA